MKHSLIFVTYFLLLTLSPVILQAHGLGESLEKAVDGYLIDVGYSPPFLETGEVIRFDFNLLNNQTQEEIPFTDIWVRIEEGKKVVFAGGIAKARLGVTGMSYVFPNEGEYTLFARFQNGEDSLAEASFPLVIERGVSAGGESFSLSPQLFIGLIGGLVIGLIPLLLKKKE